MKILYQATTNYFCVGLITEDNIITEAAPIIAWSIGKPLYYFKLWLQGKGGILRKIKEIEC